MRAISKAKPNCFIAQLVEPATVNRVVLGSSPSEAVKKVPMQVGTFFVTLLVEGMSVVKKEYRMHRFLRYGMLLVALALVACGDSDSSSVSSNPVDDRDNQDSLALDSIPDYYRLDSCVDVYFDKLTLVEKRDSYFLCNPKKNTSSSSVLTSSSSGSKPSVSSSSDSSSLDSSSSVSESSDSSSLASSSSSNGSAGIDLTVIYDCAEYDCVTTDYLNSKMLGSGMYGWYLDTRDNQVYRTVKIGSQTWMAQNLNYATEKSACYYDYDYYCSRFGRLYYQSEALTVCPKGWHLPSPEEWDELEDYVANELGDSTEVGNSLKSIKSWTNEMGSDLFGFSGLASRYFGEVYICGGAHGVYWTSKDCEYRCLLNDRSDLYSYWEAYSVDWGMSVRCILDADVAGEDSGS